MQKLVVLYPEPADRAAFERHYRATHLPLCATLPGVQEISFSLGIVDAPYFAMFSATFADDAALDAALASPAGQAVEADVPNYATGGAIVMRVASEQYPVS